MPSFEQEDERVAAQRVARRMRQHLTHVSRDFHGESRKNERARPVQVDGGRMDDNDAYVYGHEATGDDQVHEEEEEEVDAYVAPRPLPRRHVRATPSVSFSEPVETPPPTASSRTRQPQQQQSQRTASDPEPEAEGESVMGVMALQTPSPSSPSARVARRGRNRLETRLAELQRDVANLSMRLRASSVASQKSTSFQEEEDEGGDETTQVPLRARDTVGVIHTGKGAGTNRSVVRRDGESNGKRGGWERAENGVAVAGKSPARTILKKTTTTTVAAAVLEPQSARRGASRTRSRSRGRGGEKEDGNEEEDESPYRATVPSSRPLENGHDHDARPLRVRQGNGQQEPPRSAKEMLRVVRELRVVAVERDQLRYELDQTKRSLAALEKKHHDATKWKDAYEKIKAHCDSLQESLDLSEKIRVRQKRLLQQLQQTVQLDEAAKTRTRAHTAPHRVDVLDSVLHDTSMATATAQQLRRSTARQVDTSRAQTRSAVPTRSATIKQPTAAVNTSTRSYSRSDFDSLLQVPLPDRSVAASTVYRRSTQPKKDPVPPRPTATTRSIRPKPTVATTSTSRAPRPTQTARSNHFLAPTQASLSQAFKRRPEASRPPFVV